MDLSKLRSITNNYQDVRLLSLHTWSKAKQFEFRDLSGPYIVMQEGYDPQDVKMQYEEFLLGKSGEWIPGGLFFKLPVDIREDEFIYGNAAEVMELFGRLQGNPKIVRKGDRFMLEPEAAPDGLTQAIEQAKGGQLPPDQQ